MTQKKDAILAWLELPEKERQAARNIMRRQGDVYSTAANALQELDHLHLRAGADGFPKVPPRLVIYWHQLNTEQQRNLLGLIKPLTTQTSPENGGAAGEGA